MLIDKLDIFTDIKYEVTQRFNIIEIYAVGSRAKGISKKGKWDFDVAVVTKERLNPRLLTEVISPLFKSRLDEFGKPIRIDFWTVTEDKKENFLNVIKLGSNAILL